MSCYCMQPDCPKCGYSSDYAERRNVKQKVLDGATESVNYKRLKPHIIDFIRVPASPLYSRESLRGMAESLLAEVRRVEDERSPPEEDER